MVRLRLMAAAVLVLAAASGAEAQLNTLTGMVTAHIGGATGGDVRDRGTTLGASLAVIEDSGLGAELDLGHTRRFDPARFGESGITTFMVNAIGIWREPIVKPFFLAGVGVIRVRASGFDDNRLANRTDVGFNAGGGGVFFVSEAFAVRGDVRYFRYLQRHADLPLLDNGFFDFWRISAGATYMWPIR